MEWSRKHRKLAPAEGPPAWRLQQGRENRQAMCHGGTRQHPIAARYEKPRRMPKTAEDYPGLIKLWAIKKDFMGCWEPKARNHTEMPNLLGRRAMKRIEIAELELDEG